MYNNEFLQNNSTEDSKKEEILNDSEDVNNESKEFLEEESTTESKEEIANFAKEKIDSLNTETEESLEISENEKNAIQDLDGDIKELENLTKPINDEIINVNNDAKEEIVKWLKLDDPKFDENNFYRIINEDGYRDFVDNKIVRSRQETQEMKDMSVRERINFRHPTPFPSFAKGVPNLEYAKKGEYNYILESDVPMYCKGDKNPVTGYTIHSKHGAYRPYNEEGLWREEMSPEEIKNVYKIDKEGGVYMKNIEENKKNQNVDNNVENEIV